MPKNAGLSILDNRHRVFIDDLTGMCFKYYFADVYHNASLHVNIQLHEGGDIDTAYDLIVEHAAQHDFEVFTRNHCITDLELMDE